MARTKQGSRKSTGGTAPHASFATGASIVPIPAPQGSFSTGASTAPSIQADDLANRDTNTDSHDVGRSQNFVFFLLTFFK
jgi:hypothetical protein